MMSANLRAFLYLIAWCEGTSGPNGYRTIVGGEKFDDFSDHPNRIKSGTFSNGKAWRSSAAGRYQFLHSTWLECKHALSLPDFSPESQDAAAVYLIKRRGALHAVEQGDLDNAIHLCRHEWASLPGSPYGQPTKTLAECRAVFQRAGGVLITRTVESGEAAGTPQQPSAFPSTQPAGNPPQGSATLPPAVPAAPRFPSSESEPNIMPLPAAAAVALGAELLKLLPMFSSGSKVAERNVAAGQAVGGKLLEIAKEVAGPALNEQAAVEAVQKNAQLRDQFVAKAVANWSDFAPAWEAEEKSRREARAFGVELMSDGPAWRQIGAGVLIGTLSLTIILGGGAMFWSLMSSPQLDPGQKGLILGALLSVFSSTAAYWFGSSASSRIKDQTISEQARK